MPSISRAATSSSAAANEIAATQIVDPSYNRTARPRPVERRGVGFLENIVATRSNLISPLSSLQIAEHQALPNTSARPTAHTTRRP
jgi:hypothetical protein